MNWVKSIGRALIKVLDFGLAKLKSNKVADGSSLTAPGTVMGTLGYMSPEQLQGREVDERSDSFSVGVMVVEALTGQMPFRGRTYPEVLKATLLESYHLESEAEGAKRLDGVLQKCLAKEREQRYASVAEMQQALIPAIKACPRFAPAAATSHIMSSEDVPTYLPTT